MGGGEGESEGVPGPDNAIITVRPEKPVQRNRANYSHTADWASTSQRSDLGSQYVAEANKTATYCEPKTSSWTWTVPVYE